MPTLLTWLSNTSDINVGSLSNRTLVLLDARIMSMSIPTEVHRIVNVDSRYIDINQYVWSFYHIDVDVNRTVQFCENLIIYSYQNNLVWCCRFLRFSYLCLFRNHQQNEAFLTHAYGVPRLRGVRPAWNTLAISSGPPSLVGSGAEIIPASYSLRFGSR